MESFPHIWSIWLLCFPVLCTLLLHQARYWQLYWRCPVLWLLCHYQRPCDGHDWCCWLRVYFDLLAENFCQYQGRLDASASNCIILLPPSFSYIHDYMVGRPDQIHTKSQHCINKTRNVSSKTSFIQCRYKME